MRARLPTIGRIMQILNIAAYKFVALDPLPELKAALLEALATRGIKGTVLLAEEGINLFLAGSRAGDPEGERRDGERTDHAGSPVRAGG